MLNFLTNVYQERSTAKNSCSVDMDMIQGCLGCDGECLYSCYSMCANECQGETQDTGGNNDYCNSHCTGTCFTVASIIGVIK